MNGKLPELSAILAYHQMPLLERVIAGRQRWNTTYRDALAGVPGIRFQRIPAGARSNHQYTAILIEPDEFGRSRDHVRHALLEHGIVTKPYFSPPLHHLTCYAGKLRCDDLRVTDSISESVLCLPIHPDEPVDAAAVVAERIRSLARPPRKWMSSPSVSVHNA